MNLDPKVWGTVFPELLETPDPGQPDSIRTRPILGFRINQIQIVRDQHRPVHLGLTSLANSAYSWEPGKNRATCLRSVHGAPAPGCSCGLHACHELSAVAWLTRTGLKLRGLVVLTAVAGTGIVRIHERGWRAQFARIVAFSDELPGLTGGLLGFRAKVIGSEVARALEDKYQVPVVALGKLADVVRRAGDFWEGEP